MKKSAGKLDITIVNYNCGVHILNCLDSLSGVVKKLGAKIYVVDNASSDGSIDEVENKFLEVVVIRNRENVGFGRAHNQAIKKGSSEYVLVLNPDTLVGDGVIEQLIRYMDENREVGVISPKIVFENGRVDMTAHRGLPTPTAAFKYYFLKDDSQYHLTGRDFSTPHEVDSVSGAFFLTRRKILDEVGLFDEDYFMYAEDIDLCYRIKRAGYKIIYYPSLEIVHLKGISSGIKSHSIHQTKTDLEARKRALDSFYETMWIFYSKHLAKSYPFVVNWMVWLGINLKWQMAKRKLVV